MKIQMDFISGINVGVEYMEDDLYEGGGLLIDLFIVRFLITWA